VGSEGLCLGALLRTGRISRRQLRNGNAQCDRPMIQLHRSGFYRSALPVGNTGLRHLKPRCDGRVYEGSRSNQCDRTDPWTALGAPAARYGSGTMKLRSCCRWRTVRLVCPPQRVMEALWKQIESQDLSDRRWSALTWRRKLAIRGPGSFDHRGDRMAVARDAAKLSRAIQTDSRPR
jgi:hypothetical protein